MNHIQKNAAPIIRPNVERELRGWFVYMVERILFGGFCGGFGRGIGIGGFLLFVVHSLFELCQGVVIQFGFVGEFVDNAASLERIKQQV